MINKSEATFNLNEIFRKRRNFAKEGMCSFCTSFVFISRNPGTAYIRRSATEDIVVLNIIKSPQVLYHEFVVQTTGKFIIKLS